MKYMRFSTRQRIAIFLAGICILLFLANRRAFLQKLHSQPPPLISSTTPSNTSSSPVDSSSIPPPSPSDLPSSPSPSDSDSDSDSSASSSNSTGSPPKYNPALSPVCSAYPDLADVVIVVKTGGTEAFQKIPTQLLTFLQCAKDDVLIFSDMEQDIGGHHIYDSLDKVIEKTKKDNPDFDLYNTQKEYKLVGGEVSSLDRSQDAWRLDKYKNIHTAQKAYQMRPNKSWYFFIDADTYIVWSNFFQWLKRLNPAEKLYLGSRVGVGNPPFAHGGSGYLLSRAAMGELVGKDAVEVAARYDGYAIPGCCGDQELARILFEKGINATNVRPKINGDRPRSLPFGPAQWCQPLITMHHMSPEEINDMWQFEEQRALPNDLLLIEDFFHAYIEPKIIPYRDEWDNVSNDDVLKAPDNDKEKKGGWWRWSEPYDSLNACSQACEQEPCCFQFSYYEGVCALSAAFKLGEKKLSKDGVTYKSGWNIGKIAKFKAQNSPCKGPQWESEE